jgi:hypothetical protein
MITAKPRLVKRKRLWQVTWLETNRPYVFYQEFPDRDQAVRFAERLGRNWLLEQRKFRDIP